MYHQILRGIIKEMYDFQKEELIFWSCHVPQLQFGLHNWKFSTSDKTTKQNRSKGTRIMSVQAAIRTLEGRYVLHNNNDPLHRQNSFLPVKSVFSKIIHTNPWKVIGNSASVGKQSSRVSQFSYSPLGRGQTRFLSRCRAFWYHGFFYQLPGPVNT